MRRHVGRTLLFKSRCGRKWLCVLTALGIPGGVVFPRPITLLSRAEKNYKSINKDVCQASGLLAAIGDINQALFFSSWRKKMHVGIEPFFSPFKFALVIICKIYFLCGRLFIVKCVNVPITKWDLSNSDVVYLGKPLI